MKSNRLFLLAAFSFIALIQLNAQTVKIKDQVESVEKFLELRDKIATTPEGGASIFLLALKIYTDNPKLGKQCLVIAVNQDNLKKGDVYMGYELQAIDMIYIKKQIIEKNRKLPNAYMVGSSAEKGYEVKLPYTYEFMSNPASGDASTGTYKLFVNCSGSDKPREITVKKNNRGLWKASEWSQLLEAVKKPPVDDKL